MGERTQRWRELLEHLTDMVLLVDRDGRLEWANHGIGCERSFESEGGTLADVLPLDMVPRIERAVAELDGRERRLELADDDHGSGERHLEFRLKPGPTDGQVTIVVRDVSERHREMVARLQRLDHQARAEALLEVAYVASHDLKAPLRHIMSLAEWLDEDAGETLDEDARGTLGLLRTNVAKMDQLLSALLDYARAGNNHDEIEVEALDLRTCILEVIEILPTDGFRIEVPEAMPTIHTARSPFERVVLNLIANAVKHHDRGEGRIVISGQTEGEHYELAIADDGPGIPDDKRVEAFKMFKKLGRHHRDGSGMGLALVKKLVEQAGGQITVEGNEPRGCVFKIRWPLQWAPTEGPKTQRAPTSQRVMVVDDSALARELTRRMLTRRGFEVIEATSPRRALALLNEQPVDVVLTDLNMPGKDGYALVAQLRRERPTLPVIVLTAEPGQAHVDRAKEAGAYAYLVKPVKGSALAAELKAAIEQLRPRR